MQSESLRQAELDRQLNLLIDRSSATHVWFIGTADGSGMSSQFTESHMYEELGIVWSLVLLQGAILVVSTIESLVANAVQGFALIGITAITGAAAFLALLCARELRRQRRWARRLTITAEWFVLAIGTVDTVATLFLDSNGLDIVPSLTGVIVPMAILILLHRTKPLFGSDQLVQATASPTADAEVAV